MTWQRVTRVALADFRERVRTYRYLVILGLTAYAGFVALPPAGAGYSVMVLAGSRGVYNSAWVGAVVALFTTMVLSLPGFFLVNNAIRRDRATGVGQILAASPLTRWQYMLGKLLSNLLLLCTMVGVLVVTAACVQQLRGEVAQFELWPLLSPFLLITLPTVAVVSALALVFEATPWLRGGFGSVVYVVLWMTGLSVPSLAGPRGGNPLWDLTGLGMLWRQIGDALPGYRGGLAFIGDMRVAHTFQWSGVDWTAGMVLSRLMWLGVALLLTALATLLFDRFDPGSGRLRRRPEPQEAPPEPRSIRTPAPLVHRPYRPLTQPLHFGFLPMAGAEFRLLLREAGRRWQLVALVLWALSLVIPAIASQRFMLMVVWAWPLLVWSQMGARDERPGVSDLVATSAYAPMRPLAARWVAGVLLAALMGSGIALQLVRAAAWPELFGWLAGAVFAPTFALVLGSLTHSSKPFEVIYLLVLYVGPGQKVPWLDFPGLSAEATAFGVPAYYLLGSLAAGSLMLLYARSVRRRPA